MTSKKEILLINPWIYDFTAYDFWLKPLGLLYMASLLKKYTNFRLSFIDCLDRHHPLLPKKMKTGRDGRGPFPKQEVPKPAVLRGVPRKYSRYGIPIPLFLSELDRVPPPDLVLLSCSMTYWYPGLQLVAELVRKKFGHVPVVLGGVYATLLPEHARKSTGVDIVVQGPGEKIISQLIKEIFGNGHFPDIELESLDEIPWPAFDLVRDKEHLPLLTSRGCPFKCSFCASPLLYKRFEQRKPSSVAAEIEHNFRQFNTRNFAFYDDALLFQKEKHFIPLLREIIEMRLPLAFHTPNGLHLREIDFELATLFKRANVQSLFLSQESFEEKVLEKASAKVSTNDLEKALESLEKAGYVRHDISVYLMVGLPGQDTTGIEGSVLHVRRLGARPRLAYFSPIPGTDEWQALVKEGIISQDADPLIHNKLTFPYLWGNFSPEEFESLKNLLNKP